MKSILKQALVIMLAVVLVTGCKKEEDKGDPPVSPPASSMLIDFSNFMPGKKSDSFEAVKGLRHPTGSMHMMWPFSGD
jgi:hypothetical protein